MTTKFETLENNGDGIQGGRSFDLLVFEQSKHYLCYVEAVHMLYHENVKKDCEFLQRKNDDIFSSVHSKTFTDTKFLHKGDRTKEYFFVLDNTEWPEALDDKYKWKPTKKYSED